MPRDWYTPRGTASAETGLEKKSTRPQAPQFGPLPDKPHRHGVDWRHLPSGPEEQAALEAKIKEHQATFAHLTRNPSTERSMNLLLRWWFRYVAWFDPDVPVDDYWHVSVVDKHTLPFFTRRVSNVHAYIANITDGTGQMDEVQKTHLTVSTVKSWFTLYIMCCIRYVFNGNGELCAGKFLGGKDGMWKELHDWLEIRMYNAVIAHGRADYHTQNALSDSCHRPPIGRGL
jgi:hypothetical protein